MRHEAGRTSGSAAIGGVSEPKTTFFGEAILRTMWLYALCGFTHQPNSPRSQSGTRTGRPSALTQACSVLPVAMSVARSWAWTS